MKRKVTQQNQTILPKRESCGLSLRGIAGKAGIRRIRLHKRAVPDTLELTAGAVIAGVQREIQVMLSQGEDSVMRGLLEIPRFVVAGGPCVVV